MTRLTKDTKEFQMFAEYWQIYQEFYEADNSDAYWDKLTKRTDEFIKKYQTQYARDLMFAFMDKQERELKEKLQKSA